MTEPGSASAVMTAAYYNGKDNGVDIHSGRGYTRNGKIKPDFAAPGVGITGLERMEILQSEPVPARRQALRQATLDRVFG